MESSQGRKVNLSILILKKDHHAVKSCITIKLFLAVLGLGELLGTVGGDCSPIVPSV